MGNNAIELPFAWAVTRLVPLTTGYFKLEANIVMDAIVFVRVRVSHACAQLVQCYKEGGPEDDKEDDEGEKDNSSRRLHVARGPTNPQ